MTSRPVLSIEGLALARAGRSILAGLDLSVSEREIVALMGPSGTGKTTVLRSIVALEPFDAGAIEVAGFALRPGPLPSTGRLAPLRRKIGIVFQQHCLFAHLTALENVTLAPIHALEATRAEAEKRATGLLDSLGVAARAAAYPSALSGGEAQRVAIARCLALDPQVLVMDEPTASLDPARRGELGASLRALASAGRAFLLATHDVAFARETAGHVAVLSGGRIVEQGDAARVLERPSHPATARLLQMNQGHASR
jgi:ABC-type polar amino acid transport system ATPase subunit